MFVEEQIVFESDSQAKDDYFCAELEITFEIHFSDITKVDYTYKIEITEIYNRDSQEVVLFDSLPEKERVAIHKDIRDWVWRKYDQGVVQDMLEAGDE